MTTRSYKITIKTGQDPVIDILEAGRYSDQYLLTRAIHDLEDAIAHMTALKSALKEKSHD